MSTVVNKPTGVSAPGGESRKCLVPNCGRPATRRGCCEACIRVFYRGVKAKTMTWKKLINQGLVLPARSVKRSLAAQAAARIGK